MTADLLRRVDPSRLRSLALTAALLGLLAGLVAATFASIAGEPSIRDAIEIEEEAARTAATPHDHGATDEGDDDEAHVDRSDQSGIGLFSAYALTGAAFGVLLALVSHVLRGGRPDLLRRIGVSGAVLAGALTVAPWLKYPPNPPAVGDPDTLTERQVLYVTVICLAALAGLGATVVSRHLREQGRPDHVRVPAVVATVAVPMLLAFALLPGAPDDVLVPATLVWRFRLASLGANLTLWTVLVLALGWVATEADRRRSSSPAGLLAEPASR
jgi:predicted cobalt transporter CbtA